jgi:hypothetical protein
MVHSFRQGALSKGWRSWVEHYKDAKSRDKRRVLEGTNIFGLTNRLRLKCMGRALRRLYRQTLLLAANQHSVGLAKCREEEVRSLVVSRAMTLFRNRATFSVHDRLRVAMLRWHAFIRNRNRSQKMFKRTLKLLLNRALQIKLCFFRRWHTVAAALQRQLLKKIQHVKLLLRVASDARDAELARVLMKWRALVAIARVEDKKKREEKKRLLGLVGTAMRRRAHGLVGESWRAWMSFVVLHRSRQHRAAELALNALRRLSRMSLSKGWACWAGFMAEHAKFVSKRQSMLHAGGAGIRAMSRILTNRTRKNQKDAFCKWVMQWRNANQLRREILRRDEVMSSFAKKMMSQKLQCAWRSWCSYVTELKRAENLLRCVSFSFFFLFLPS